MNGRIDPTPEQAVKLAELVSQGAGIRTVMRELGSSEGPSTRWIREERARQGLPGVIDPTKLGGLQRDIHEQRISEAYRQAVRLKAEYAIFKHREIHRWRAPIEGPIGVAFVGDVHLGSSYVDYAQEELDRRLIRETEGLYVIAGGDGIDNPIKHVSMMVSASMNATEQWRWLGDWVSDLADKLVAIIGGNHEEWTVAATGFDPLMEIVRRLGPTPVDPARLRIDLGVGTQTYRVFVTHKSRMNSTFNASHSVKQLHRLNEVFDVGVACDRHTFALEPWVANTGLMTWCARPGSYQITSGFARGKGFGEALPASPVIIFDPDKREMYGCVNVEQGARVLSALRDQWRRSNELETNRAARHGSGKDRRDRSDEGRRRDASKARVRADRSDPRRAAKSSGKEAGRDRHDARGSSRQGSKRGRRAR